MAKRKVDRNHLILSLRNWNVLNEMLMGYKEKDVAFLLDHETKHANRITFTMRLHSRLTKLRRERERKVLAGSSTTPAAGGR